MSSGGLFKKQAKGAFCSFSSEKLRWTVQTELFYRGVLVAATLNSYKTIRLEPPLIITKAQIDLAVRTIKSVLDDLVEGKLKLAD